MTRLRYAILAGLALALAGGPASPALGWFPGVQKVLDQGLLEQISKGDGRVKVIVMLKGYEKVMEADFSGNKSLLDSFSSASAQAQSKVVSLLTLDQAQVTNRFELLPGFAAEVNQAGLMALAANPEVATIEEDMAQEAFTRQGTQLINVGGFRASEGGKGLAVAVIDTGVNYNHPALGGGRFPNAKVIGGYDFVGNKPDPLDDHYHGTACAGIVAGVETNHGDFIGGVAPQAKIYGLKVLDSSGRGNFSLTLKSWEWVLKHQKDDPSHPIMIISQSLGGGAFADYCDETPNQVVRSMAVLSQSLVKNGITIFIASGNDGHRDKIAFASCLRGVISVGAVYDGGPVPRKVCTADQPARDLVTCYSNSAKFLTILAPSECAEAPAKGEYNTCFNGTSAATPYAAGAGAVIQSYFKRTTGKYLPPEELKRRLVASGDPVKDPKSGVTTPRVNLARAIGGAPTKPGDDRPGGDGSPVDKLRDIIKDSKKQ